MRVVLSILLLLPSLAVVAQSKPFGETLEVRIINVDVVVTDKDGNPIPGLTAGDFEIFENGKRQPVTNFAEYREAPPTGDEATGEALPITVAARTPETRRLIFFIDRLQLVETANREDFFRGLRAFVEDSMRETDEAAVYFFGTSLHTLVGMTPDRGAILDAFAKIEEESRLRTDMESMELTEIDARARMYASDAAAGVPGSEGMEELDRRQAAQRAYDEQRRKTLAINTVIQGVAGLEGRKVMVLVTHRFSKLPGLEFYPSTEFNARKMMDAIVDNANAAGVTIYGLYPQGLLRDQVGTKDYDLLMSRAETIESIATRTGGIAALGGRLAAEALDRTTQHLSNYYSLAYRAPDNRDDRERKIRVEVGREDVKVLARNAVIDKSDEEVARDRLVAATLFGESESAIRITAAQNGGRKTGLTTWTIPIEITIPISQLTSLPTPVGYEGRFRVMAAAANADGDVSEVAEKVQSFRIPEGDIDKARAGHFTYVLEIKVRDTSERAVVAVWDEVDRESGYAEIALDLTRATDSNVKPSRQNPTGRSPIGGRSGNPFPH